MSEGENQKRYDLEERTFQVAQRVRKWVNALPRTAVNVDDIRQLLRCSGSVPANYIEANDSLGKKDFQMHVRICRKESKESRLFLRLLEANTAESEAERLALVQEATELMNIFGAILRNSGG